LPVVFDRQLDIKMVANKCAQCGGTDIDFDSTRGDAVCMNCGNVLEEGAVVNEVTFQESSNGASAVVGQFVSEFGGVRGRGGYGKDAREVTLALGRRIISRIASVLQLSSHHIDAAQRFFLLAVQHNFIQGRRMQNVVSACLYVVCRREKTAHMLVDFSDALQTNLYELGAVFLRFCRLLNLRLPVVDPSLYIHRFASKLDFGDSTHSVAMTALRLVSRMKRDWMSTGRRPAGICGSCLFIAAKMHGFYRTAREIVVVVRVAESTLKQRLTEFEQTPSALLTTSQFEEPDILDLYEECDPPAFQKLQRLGQVPDEGVLHVDATAPAGRAFPDSAVGLPVADDAVEEARRVVSLFEEIDKDGSSASTSALGDGTAALSAASTSQGGAVLSVNPNDPDLVIGRKRFDLEHVPTDDVDDTELDDYLASEEESRARCALWEEVNREFLEAQEEKRRREIALVASTSEADRKKKARKLSVDTVLQSAQPQHSHGFAASSAVLRMMSSPDAVPVGLRGSSAP
jgi:transcription factor IIIB subunit 2